MTHQITHYNIDEATGFGQWLDTLYEVDKAGNVVVLKSYADGVPYPARYVNIVDLEVSILQKTIEEAQ